MKCECEVAVWFDLLLILLAISSWMRTTRFLAREFDSLNPGGNEAGFNGWPARLQAAPAEQSHSGQEY